MRALRAAAIAALLVSVGLMASGAMRGQVRVGFFLIIPYVVGTGLLPFLAMLLLIAGLVGLVISAIPRGAPWEPSGSPPREGEGAGTDDIRAPVGERRASHGGVVLLGPIPIVWGSDRRILPWMVGAGVALLLLAMWLALR